MVPLVDLGNSHSSSISFVLQAHFASCFLISDSFCQWVLVLSNFQFGLIIVGQGPTVLAVGASKGCWDSFLVSPYRFSFLSPSL